MTALCATRTYTHKKNTNQNKIFAEEKVPIINCWCCNTRFITPLSIITATQASVDTPGRLAGWAIVAVSHLNNVGDSRGISDKREGFNHLSSSRSHSKWLILAKVGQKKRKKVAAFFMTRLWLSIAVEEIRFMAVWLSPLTFRKRAHKKFARAGRLTARHFNRKCGRK